jgi:hypothetical protein
VRPAVRQTGLSRCTHQAPQTRKNRDAKSQFMRVLSLRRVMCRHKRNRSGTSPKVFKITRRAERTVTPTANSGLLTVRKSGSQALRACGFRFSGGCGIARRKSDQNLFGEPNLMTQLCDRCPNEAAALLSDLTYPQQFVRERVQQDHACLAGALRLYSVQTPFRAGVRAYYPDLLRVRFLRGVSCR